MNTIRNAILAAGCLMAMTSAHAQLGGWGSSLSGLASMGASMLAGAPVADAGGDVDSFVSKSAALSELAGKSVAAINAAFASQEQLQAKRAALAAIAQVTDAKARQAKYAELYKAESAEAQRLLDSGEMERRMSQLDSEKKKLIGQALFNFALGSLQAVDLGRDGQALVQRAGLNPVELVRMVPVKDAIPLLGKVALDATGFLAGVAKLARSNDIAVQDAKAGAKPADIDV
jgi:hypothetical protein